jgi:hypothetical protein
VTDQDDELALVTQNTSDGDQVCTGVEDAPQTADPYDEAAQ